MPLHEDYRRYTAFTSFRGIYESTRVPIGLLPSANFFQKSMGVYVLSELLYKICEVYIDVTCLLWSNDDKFIDNVRTVFQRCREKNVTLNSKQIMMGKDKEKSYSLDMIDSSGINMSQKCRRGYSVHETTYFEELQTFLDLINDFKDHLDDHSLIDRPLYQLVADSTKSGYRTLTWSCYSTADAAFESIWNHYQKLYFIDYSLKNMLHIDASDYAHGTYLCQERTTR